MESLEGRCSFLPRVHHGVGRVEVIDILESDALESPWWRRADRRQDTLAQIAAGATVFELD